MSDKLIRNVIETGRSLHEEGIMDESVLVSLIDLHVISLEERTAELEGLVRTLAHALWYHQAACDGDEQACNDIQEALALVESQYINFME